MRGCTFGFVVVIATEESTHLQAWHWQFSCCGAACRLEQRGFTWLWRIATARATAAEASLLLQPEYSTSLYLYPSLPTLHRRSQPPDSSTAPHVHVSKRRGHLLLGTSSLSHVRSKRRGMLFIDSTTTCCTWPVLDKTAQHVLQPPVVRRPRSIKTTQANAHFRTMHYYPT
jgi:hypothetical protein